MRALFLAAALALAADAPPGRVLRAQGEVGFKQQGAGEFKPDARIEGRRVDPGDRLKTLDGARAHLSLPMGSLALASPGTTFGLDRAGTDAQAALAEGEALFALTRPLDRGWSLSVRTRSALATLESGACWIRAGEDRSTRVRVLAGSARVRAQGRTVRVKAGREVRVRFGAPPADPELSTGPAVSTGSFAIDGSLSGAERAWEQRN